LIWLGKVVHFINVFLLHQLVLFALMLLGYNLYQAINSSQFVTSMFYVGWTLAFALALPSILQIYLDPVKDILNKVSILKEVNPDTEKRVLNLCEKISNYMGTATPKTLFIDRPLRVFSVGRNPLESIIVLPTKIVEMLTPSELETVLTHEIWHINTDVEQASQMVNSFGIKLWRVVAVMIPFGVFEIVRLSLSPTISFAIFVFYEQSLHILYLWGFLTLLIGLDTIWGFYHTVSLFDDIVFELSVLICLVYAVFSARSLIGLDPIFLLIPLSLFLLFSITLISHLLLAADLGTSGFSAWDREYYADAMAALTTMRPRDLIMAMVKIVPIPIETTDKVITSLLCFYGRKSIRETDANLNEIFDVRLRAELRGIFHPPITFRMQFLSFIHNVLHDHITISFVKPPDRNVSRDTLAIRWPIISRSNFRRNLKLSNKRKINAVIMYLTKNNSQFNLVECLKELKDEDIQISIYEAFTIIYALLVSGRIKVLSLGSQTSN